MKRNFNIKIYVLVFLLLPSLKIFSEIPIESVNKNFNNAIEEKLKVNLDEFVKDFNQNPQKYLTKVKENNSNIIQGTTNGEEQITKTDMPESELTIAMNPKDSNNMIMVPIRQTINSTNPITLPIYYTKNFGSSWQVSSFSPMPPRSDIIIMGGGDPVCIFDANGTAYLTWISLGAVLNQSMTKIDSIASVMQYAYSTDGGATWVYNFYKNISSQIKYTPNGNLNMSLLDYFDDKQWLASDMNIQSPYFNTVYTSLSRFDSKLSNSSEILVSSLNSNSSYTFNKNLINSSQSAANSLQQFSSVSVGKNGRLLVTFYGGFTNLDNVVFATYSDDGGNTFSTPEIVSKFKFVNSRLIQSSIYDTIPGVDYSRVYPSIYNASDNNVKSPYYGNSYVCWSSYGLTTISTSGFNVYFAKSIDGGATWQAPKEISIEPVGMKADQFYPSITVNQDGVIIMGWYEQGVQGVQSLTNYVVSFSFDGGDTFTKPVVANTQPTNFLTVGLQNSKFGIGEYNQIVATKYYAIPVWADGRANNGNLDIYAAFIPISKDNSNSVSEISIIGSNYLKINISPNPVTESINLNFDTPNDDVINFYIYNLDGSLIYSGNTINKEFHLNTQNIGNGTYLVEANQNGRTAMKKIQVLK